MSLRAWAEALIRAQDLPTKLAPPPADLDDSDPGPALRIDAPGRPTELSIAEARAVRVPPIAGMADNSQRIRILHALANHELQAAELFAWALLAYPDAPASFRRGLLGILAEEQKHCRLYIERVEALGGRFGEHGVTGHFWNKLEPLEGPLEFVCTMGLTFENANLDFAQEYAAAARQVGDEETALVLDLVHREEIRHVAFAWRWLGRLKRADESPWQAYLRCVSWPLGPTRARGSTFDESARREAGIDGDFIASLASAEAVRPNGRPR